MYYQTILMILSVLLITLTSAARGKTSNKKRRKGYAPYKMDYEKNHSKTKLTINMAVHNQRTGTVDPNNNATLKIQVKSAEIKQNVCEFLEVCEIDLVYKNCLHTRRDGTKYTTKEYIEAELKRFKTGKTNKFGTKTQERIIKRKVNKERIWYCLDIKGMKLTESCEDTVKKAPGLFKKLVKPNGFKLSELNGERAFISHKDELNKIIITFNKVGLYCATCEKEHKGKCSVLALEEKEPSQDEEKEPSQDEEKEPSQEEEKNQGNSSSGEATHKGESNESSKTEESSAATQNESNDSGASTAAPQMIFNMGKQKILKKKRTLRSLDEILAGFKYESSVEESSSSNAEEVIPKKDGKEKPLTPSEEEKNEREIEFYHQKMMKKFAEDRKRQEEQLRKKQKKVVKKQTYGKPGFFRKLKLHKGHHMTYGSMNNEMHKLRKQPVPQFNKDVQRTQEARNDEWKSNHEFGNDI